MKTICTRNSGPPSWRSVCLALALVVGASVFLFSCGGEDKKEGEVSSGEGVRPLVAQTLKLMEEKNYEKARTSAEDLMLRDKEGKDTEAMYVMALVYLKMDRLQDAGDVAQKALDVDPNFGGPYSILAEIKYRHNRFDEAIELARNALRLDPKLALAYKVVGELYLRQGKAKDSVQVLKTAQKLTPDDIEILNKLASAYIKTNDYQSALSTLESAYKIDAKNPGVNFNLALVHSELKDGSKALYYINEAEKLYVEADDAHWSGKARNTKRIIAKLFKLRPEDIAR